MGTFLHRYSDVRFQFATWILLSENKNAQEKLVYFFFLYIDKSVHIHLIVSLVISDNLSPNIVECYCEIFIEHTYIYIVSTII